MGKKNKNKTVNPRIWGHANPKKYAELKERFNVSGADGGKPDNYGSGSERRTKEDVYNDIMHAARNDYDLRRTTEAAAMSGKKKAKDLLDRGMNNIGDVANMTNFSRKAAERRGVKNFSSATDYMGLTQSMVERDRRKLNESVDTRIDAGISGLRDELTEKKEERSWNDASEEVELSPEMQAAEERVGAWTSSNGGGDVFGASDDQQDASAMSPNDTDSYTASQSYLDNYKNKLKSKGKFVSTM